MLVTAEVLAVPFYRALRDAARSTLLHSICKRILRDEAAHLNYQALTIGLLRRPLGRKARAIRSFCHSLLFHGTALLLWRQHRRVFSSAGWNFLHFWTRASRAFAQFQTRISCITAPPTLSPTEDSLLRTGAKEQTSDERRRRDTIAPFCGSHPFVSKTSNPIKSSRMWKSRNFVSEIICSNSFFV